MKIIFVGAFLFAYNFHVMTVKNKSTKDHLRRIFSDLYNRLRKIEENEITLPYTPPPFHHQITPIKDHVGKYDEIQALDKLDEAIGNIKSLHKRIFKIVTAYKIPELYNEYRSGYETIFDHPDPKIPTREIKNKICNFHREELEFYLQELQSLRRYTVKMAGSSITVNGESAKIQLNISSRKLAALFRILWEMGLIKEKNKWKLAESLSESFMGSRGGSAVEVIYNGMFDALDRNDIEFWGKTFKNIDSDIENIIHLQD